MVSTAIHTKENLQGKDVTITDAKNARRAKVSAWIYYRQLFAKKENLQYKEMIAADALIEVIPMAFDLFTGIPPKFRQVT